MKRTHVRDVMTRQVIAVAENTQFKDIVRAMRRYRVTAVPVVDSAGLVLGLVSAADLVVHEAAARSGVSVLDPARRRRERIKADAGVAVELMTAPALTIGPLRPAAEAAELMRRHRVNQLPVAEERTGRLVGLLTHTDLLKVYDRPDSEIQAEIDLEVMPGHAGTIAQVRNGVVILHGYAGDRGHRGTGLVPALLEVEGVVHVVDQRTGNADPRGSAAAREA